MRMPGRLRRTLRALSLATALVMAAACAAPAPNGDARAQTDTAVAIAAADPAQPQATGATPPAPKQPVRTGGPLPPERIDGVAIDATCRTDADCTVKNVGNCCGYYPACVNVDSPTDPGRVQAECARKGIASVCGFPEIASCTCNQGHCEAAPGGAQVR